MIYLILVFAFVCNSISIIKADTPANCTYEDVRGLWIFQEGPRGNLNSINCSASFDYVTAYTVQLEFPNIATDEDGNIGHWTLIYNQGFEVQIQNRKYFAFSLYKQDGQNVTSYCDTTFPGWSHTTGVNPSDWACYIGTKYNKIATPKVYKRLDSDLFENHYKQRLYKTNHDLVSEINNMKTSWTAKHYEFLNDKSIYDLIRMAGGKNSRIISKPRPAEITDDLKQLVDALPESVDWRNVSGVNYVSPIRNQGSCGSCYAFASMAMNEARLKIKTFNQQQLVFAPQDIVECSEYSQGCDGGFPYLISGKYAEDFGLVEESCNPYTGKDGTCHTQMSCPRSFSTYYQYVGGFYGACNEALMRIELAKNGPIVVGFEVYDDFFNYAGGVYHHTFNKDHKNFQFSPFELTNHAVLIVGYGTDATGQDYWIVKNSWGESWGENGFFRIRRGTDECAIESLAVSSSIVV